MIISYYQAYIFVVAVVVLVAIVTLVGTVGIFYTVGAEYVMDKLLKVLILVYPLHVEFNSKQKKTRTHAWYTYTQQHFTTLPPSLQKVHSTFKIFGI